MPILTCREHADEAKRKEEEKRMEEVRREEEKRLQEEARVRQASILEEQQKEAEAARVRAQAEARKRAEAERIAAKAAELEGWKGRIKERVHSKVVVPPGVPDNARAEYTITLIPGGEVLNVKLRKSSGFPAYDAAIERAINAASPLPVPSEPGLFQQMRELNLVFLPN